MGDPAPRRMDVAALDVIDPYVHGQASVRPLVLEDDAVMLLGLGG